MPLNGKRLRHVWEAFANLCLHYSSGHFCRKVSPPYGIGIHSRIQPRQSIDSFLHGGTRCQCLLSKKLLHHVRDVGHFQADAHDVLRKKKQVAKQLPPFVLEFSIDQRGFKSKSRSHQTTFTIGVHFVYNWRNVDVATPNLGFTIPVRKANGVDAGRTFVPCNGTVSQTFNLSSNFPLCGNGPCPPQMIHRTSRTLYRKCAKHTGKKELAVYFWVDCALPWFVAGCG